MIIFYEKKTGTIVGSIAGRVNTPVELNMWIGDKEKTERIVITWKPIKTVRDLMGRIKEQEFRPEHPQKELFELFDKSGLEIYKYKVNPKNYRLEKNVKLK